MHTGKVKFFNEENGFGFITDSDSGKDYFVHISGLVNPDTILIRDSIVEFDVRKNKKDESKTEAFNVKLFKSQ